MKCTGLMGRIFGHKWELKREINQPQYITMGNRVYAGRVKIKEYQQCQRCGALTGEKK